MPGALDGGFSLLSSGTFPVTGYDGPNGSAWPEHEVEAWGDATLAPATWTLDVDGTEMTVEVYEVGPPALAGPAVQPRPEGAPRRGGSWGSGHGAQACPNPGPVRSGPSVAARNR